MAGGLNHIKIIVPDPFSPARALIEVDGKRLKQVTDVAIDIGVDRPPTVTIRMLATPADFDIHGQFKPLIELIDVDTMEEQATREVYERLKARFETQ